MQVRGAKAAQVRAGCLAKRPSRSDRDCPLDTARALSIWHVGGTAGENHDARAWRRRLQLGRRVRPDLGDQLPRWQVVGDGAAGPSQAPGRLPQESFPGGPLTSATRRGGCPTGFADCLIPTRRYTVGSPGPRRRPATPWWETPPAAMNSTRSGRGRTGRSATGRTRSPGGPCKSRTSPCSAPGSGRSPRRRVPSPARRRR
jgi:hypothetical protein